MVKRRAESIGPVKYINLVGIELEGAWEKYNQAGECIRNQAPQNLKGDSSVETRLRYNQDFCYDDNNCNGPSCSDRCDKRHGWIGEIASHAIVPQPHVLGQWITRNYPDKVDSSCGLHIHASFINNNDYAKLVTEKFGDFLNAELKKFGKKYNLSRYHRLWTRLDGEYYCEKSFIGEAQISGLTEHRYTQVNYYAYHQHGTVEIRTLPAFRDCYIAIAAIYTVIRSIEKFLTQFDLDIENGTVNFQEFTECDHQIADNLSDIKEEIIDLGESGRGVLSKEVQNVNELLIV